MGMVCRREVLVQRSEVCKCRRWEMDLRILVLLEMVDGLGGCGDFVV